MAITSTTNIMPVHAPALKISPANSQLVKHKVKNKANKKLLILNIFHIAKS